MPAFNQFVEGFIVVRAVHYPKLINEAEAALAAQGFTLLPYRKPTLDRPVVSTVRGEYVHGGDRLRRAALHVMPNGVIAVEYHTLRPPRRIESSTVE